MTGMATLLALALPEAALINHVRFTQPLRGMPTGRVVSIHPNTSLRKLAHWMRGRQGYGGTSRVAERLPKTQEVGAVCVIVEAALRPAPMSLAEGMRAPYS